MVTVTDFVENLKSLNVLEEAAGAIEDTREQLKDIQRDQLLHGIKGDGSKIGKYRSNKYAAAKFSLNPLAGLGNVDLKLTGDVHREIFVDVRDQDYIIDSADPKMDDLIEKYGDPFGLDDDSDEKYIDGSLEEAFIKRVELKTGL